MAVLCLCFSANPTRRSVPVWLRSERAPGLALCALEVQARRLGEPLVSRSSSLNSTGAGGRAVGGISGDQKRAISRVSLGPAKRRQNPGICWICLQLKRHRLGCTAAARRCHPQLTGSREAHSRGTPLCFHFRSVEPSRKSALSLSALSASLSLPSVREHPSASQPRCLCLYAAPSPSNHQHLGPSLPSRSFALCFVHHTCGQRQLRASLQAHLCTAANPVLNASDTRSSLLSTSTWDLAPIEAPIVSQTV